MENWNIGDVVWLVEMTRHKYVRYVVKNATIEGIDNSRWRGGSQTLYETSLCDCSPQRSASDFFTSEDEARAKCKDRNEIARTARKEWRKQEAKLKRAEREKEAKPHRRYDSPEWQEMITRRGLK